MTSLTSRVLLITLGLCIAGLAYGQFGGGRGGQGGSSNRERGDPTIDGPWFLEFELEFDSDNPQATGQRITLRADLTVTGILISARFRRPAEGEFTCTMLDGSDRCESGRMLVVWPDQDIRESATFEFVVDRIDNRRADGEAMFTNSSTGAVRLYSVDMRKR